MKLGEIIENILPKVLKDNDPKYVILRNIFNKSGIIIEENIVKKKK